MSSLNIFDALIAICGIYMIVNGILMKVQGKINTSLVMAKNVTEDQISDKEGFIKYMWSKLVIIGVICTASGVANILMSRFDIPLAADLALNAVFFILIIIYGVIVTKAQKKFMY